ncbi:MAG: F-box protein [Candidatus Protochlamydia sp.]|nr:F-box protein [Candidatus Protochlamydia sp.]
MNTKIEAFSADNYQPMAYCYTPLTVDNLPNEIILPIIQLLNIKDCLSSRLICHHWKVIVDDPTTTYGKYIQEIDAIKKLSFLTPSCSAWEDMPRHWGLYVKENVLKFSSCSSDIITFHPPFCHQSSSFFSFNSLIPFSERYIFLAKFGNTYFLTEQGQTPLQLELPTDLQPLASYKLIIKNFRDPSKDKEVSLLKELDATQENLSICQVKYCFPISEDNVVVVNISGEVSFWNLSMEKPICYQTIQIDASSKVYKIDNYLVLNNKTINLTTQSAIENEFNFQNEDIKTCGSALCAHNGNRREIRYFSMSSFGLFEKQWDLTTDSLLEYLDRNNGQVVSLNVRDMNEQYIVLTCWQSKSLNILLLNSNGEVIHTICQDLAGEELYNFDLYRYPHFSQITGNILIYKHPQRHTLYFWHIPTKKLIQEFEWEKLIYDMPLYFGVGLVQDVRLHEGKLTVLLSSQHTSVSNKPGKVRIIQFDPQSKSQQGWMHSIYSTIQSIYYSFPGKLSY